MVEKKVGFFSKLQKAYFGTPKQREARQKAIFKARTQAKVKRIESREKFRNIIRLRRRTAIGEIARAVRVRTDHGGRIKQGYRELFNSSSMICPNQIGRAHV